MLSSCARPGPRLARLHAVLVSAEHGAVITRTASQNTGKPPYSIWSYSKPSLVRRRPAVGNDSVRWEHAQVRSADPAACPMGSTSGLL
jgi:hypothetical protein